MDRIEQLTRFLSPCKSFADVGCDHGYCTQYMLRNGLCQTAVISDVSAKSLSKAERLLQDYVSSGVVTSVCCDGLTQIDPSVEQVLIAGMGGEEIVKILTQSFIPQTFVFQPMKNAEKLRAFLLEHGCTLTQDDLFFADGKYYFVVCGKRGGGSTYTKEEVLFGRDSLKNPLLITLLEGEIAKKKSYLSAPVSTENRLALEEEIDYLSEVIKNACQ